MPFDNDPSRLHWHQGQARLPHVQRDDLIGPGEPSLYIANRLFSGYRDVGLLIEDLRPILLERGIKSANRGQHLIINIDEFGGLECGYLALGYHCRHRFANKVDLIARHDRLRRPR